MPLILIEEGHTYLFHLHINESLRRHFGAEVVLIDDFLWDVVDLESDVFRSLEWSIEVEIANVCCHKSCSFCGYDVVEE